MVRAYVTMMGRIEAGERLAAISDQAIAAGNLRKFDADRQVARLRDAADGVRRRAVKATPEILAAMGVGVVRAPASPAEQAVSDG